MNDLGVCEADTFAAGDRRDECLVCTGIGWIARSAMLLMRRDESWPEDGFTGRRWNVLSGLFSRLFRECLPSDADPAWWSADDSVTLVAHAVVRDAMTADADLAAVLLRGFRGCREEHAMSDGELLEREVFKGSWFATVLHAFAHLTRLRPREAEHGEQTSGWPGKGQVDLSGGLNAALFRSLTLYYGWFCNTCSVQAVPEMIRREAALVNLYHCASDYAVGTELESERLRYRAERETALALPGDPAFREGLRKLPERYRIVRDAIDLRAIVDRLWMDTPPAYDEPEGMRLAKATAALCNVVEWGPMLWLTDPGEQPVQRMLMMWTLAKQVSDIVDLCIEHHETGNTARYLDGELGNVLAVREQIVNDSGWPYRDTVIFPEMYQLVGERHRHAERFADNADQKTPAIHDAWEPAVRCLAGCLVHQRQAASAAARSWTSKAEMREAASLIRRVISARCDHGCADEITYAAHAALDETAAMRRIFEMARREIASYTS